VAPTRAAPPPKKIVAPPLAEFSTARRLKPARQPDFTAASRKRLGGAAEGSTIKWPFSFPPHPMYASALLRKSRSSEICVKINRKPEKNIPNIIDHTLNKD